MTHIDRRQPAGRDGKVVLTDGAGVQTENLTSFWQLLADLEHLMQDRNAGCSHRSASVTFENGIAHVYNENRNPEYVYGSICTTLTDKNGNSAT